jgi:hypothetical protein
MIGQSSQPTARTLVQVDVIANSYQPSCELQERSPQPLVASAEFERFAYLSYLLLSLIHNLSSFLESIALNFPKSCGTSPSLSSRLIFLYL